MITRQVTTKLLMGFWSHIVFVTFVYPVKFSLDKTNVVLAEVFSAIDFLKKLIKFLS